VTKYAQIIGWGKYLPSKVITNHDLEKMVNTSDEWIVGHTGIRERRVVDVGETTSSMAVQAARAALLVAELRPTDIDLIIVATHSPDYHLPGAAPLVQHQLGALQAAAFDLRAGCPGFVYGLAVGSQFIASGAYQHVLVIGAEVTSQFLDWSDRRTCILFGDGAGAVVLESSDQPTGVLSFAMGTKGADYESLIYYAGGSKYPFTGEPLDNRLRYVHMDGRRVLSFAARTAGPAVRRVLIESGLSKNDITLVIPQQSNQRFMEWISTNLGFPMERIFVNVDRYANTSSASVAIALCEAFEQGRIKEGDSILLLSFGAGLSWAASIVHYGTMEKVPQLELVSWPFVPLHQWADRAKVIARTGVVSVTSALSWLLLPFFARSRKK